MSRERKKLRSVEARAAPRNLQMPTSTYVDTLETAETGQHGNQKNRKLNMLQSLSY
jgi:hypothetical protein